MGARGGDNARIRTPIRIREPAGPAYPPKSDSLARICENCDKKFDASTATSLGDMLSYIVHTSEE